LRCARSKKKFADKHGLTFPLLADPDHAVASSTAVMDAR
jgi:peroxiredoxin